MKTTTRIPRRSTILGQLDNSSSRARTRSRIRLQIMQCGRSQERVLCLVGLRLDIQRNAIPSLNTRPSTLHPLIISQTMMKHCEPVSPHYSLLLQPYEACLSQVNHVLIYPSPPLAWTLHHFDLSQNLWPWVTSQKKQTATAFHPPLSPPPLPQTNRSGRPTHLTTFAVPARIAVLLKRFEELDPLLTRSAQPC